eukprot:237046-Amphidinium_carterae.1
MAAPRQITPRKMVVLSSPGLSQTWKMALLGRMEELSLQKLTVRPVSKQIAARSGISRGGTQGAERTLAVGLDGPGATRTPRSIR